MEPRTLIRSFDSQAAAGWFPIESRRSGHIQPFGISSSVCTLRNLTAEHDSILTSLEH